MTSTTGSCTPCTADLMFIVTVAGRSKRVALNIRRFTPQLIGMDERFPGFILGDVPFVHGQVESRRFGFRDGLAVGDANLIIGPLTRRVAVCFTARPLPHTELRTRRWVELVNAVFWRAALQHVACHPDDILATQQMARRIGRLPARALHGL